MKKILVIVFLVVFSNYKAIASDLNTKPRVIVMTDGEIDDHSSMIRFLLYSCDMEVCAIIETNSIFQKEGHSKENWYEKQLEAYEKIYPNLKKHSPDYPTPEYLKKVSFIGDEDHDHLKGLIKKRWELKPGAKTTYTPENWKDTPGSDKIVEVLLEKNPEPVYIQAWGGGNTAARAFYKLKTKYPKDYKRALSKVVMYNIWYQDGAGMFIEQNFPEVTMLYCGSFAGTWNYRSQPNTHDFISKNVKNGHGPLGALYPQDYISEGDSPAYFYTLPNGLRNYENPTYGGWGGRFTKSDKAANVYVDATDDGDNKKSLRIWIDDVNNDYQARMDWCVKSYDEANHPPIVKINSDKNIKIKSGKKISLDAGKTKDPDRDELKFNWWQYKEPGSYDGSIELENTNSKKITFTAPKVGKPETIHLILEVKDNGSPSLKGYQRIIVEIVP